MKSKRLENHGRTGHKLQIATLCLASLLIYIVQAPAGTPVVPADGSNPIINEIQSGIDAKNLSLEVQATYAPKLAQHWGAEIRLAHPITDYAFVGVSATVLNGGYYAGSFGIGLKKTFNFWNIPVTPRLVTGAYVPFAAPAGTSDGNGAFVETGIQATLWRDKQGRADFSVGGDVKYVTSLPGIQIYGGFAQFGIHF